MNVIGNSARGKICNKTVSRMHNRGELLKASSVPLKLLWVAFAEWRSYATSSSGANTVAGYLEKNYQGKLLQKIWYYDNNPKEIKNFIAKLKKYSPDQIWFSVNIGDLPKAQQVIEAIKSSLSTNDFNKIKFVLGNREFLDKSKVLKTFKFLPNSLIVKGHGEETVLNIISDIPREFTPNLYYFNKEKVRYTFSKVFDPDNYVAPKIDWKPINLINLHLDEVSVRIEPSRGCNKKNPCSFCYNSSITGKNKKWTPLNLKEIVKNIAQHARKTPNSINFIADNFTADINRLKLLLNEIERLQKEGILSKKTKFYASVRVTDIYSSKDSKEEREKKIAIFRKMKKLGFNLLFLGIESGSNPQLKRYIKQTTREENLNAIKILNKLGIHIDGGFIMFDEILDDSLKEILENISFLRKVNAPKLLLFPFNKLIVFPGTTYAKILKKRGHRSKKVKKLFKIIDNIRSKIRYPLLTMFLYEMRRLYWEDADIKKIKLYEDLAIGHGKLCIDFLENLVKGLNNKVPDEEIKKLVKAFIIDINEYDKKIEEIVKEKVPDFSRKSNSMNLWKDQNKK